MKQFLSSFGVIITLLCFSCMPSGEKDTLSTGVQEKVVVVRDQWGINHIYAKNQHDLFFAQGYFAARDRLFQFEIWRRQATGTVAEILGEKALKRDIGTRLFKYRGDLQEEFNHYHPDGKAIIEAYVEGVNTYIRKSLAQPDSLPVEFHVLGIQPELWTAEVVISRHQGLLGNINQELNIGMAVANVGAKKVKQIGWFHPKDPILDLDEHIDGKILSPKILELYNAFRKPVHFLPEDIDMAKSDRVPRSEIEWSSIGSNNWVISGKRTSSGHSMMANDPHRAIAVPSLRYMVHLVAPGWNVIGGGEPEIPGVSIGHNEYGAWGLTVFRTDGEDLYVYDLNPANLNEYKYKDQWEAMSVVYDTIAVFDHDDVPVELRYTRHGPVTYIDSTNFKAYAVRCAWLEPGGSPYLASLRMDQAKTWKEFRVACSYSNIPGENMVWAGVDDTIGWQAVGIAPIRKNFSGLVPVPGDGRYEWEGFLPIRDKPHLSNPDAGFFATANQNVTPDTYKYWDAIGYSWSDDYRGNRINEVLGANNKVNMALMKSLQTDYLSIPARTLVPILQQLNLKNDRLVSARKFLDNWDYRLEPTSIAAAIYVEWENSLRSEARERFVPKDIRKLISPQITRVIDWLRHPENAFGNNGQKKRDDLLREAFRDAVQQLTQRLGEDMTSWQYGQLRNKHVYIRHALGDIVGEDWKDKMNCGPLPRGGNSYVPGSTGSSLNQTSGASFRIIVDTGNWDDAWAINTPGQSGNPESVFYKNLFELWANDDYFPLYFSKGKIDSVEVENIILDPTID